MARTAGGWVTGSGRDPWRSYMMTPGGPSPGAGADTDTGTAEISTGSATGAMRLVELAGSRPAAVLEGRGVSSDMVLSGVWGCGGADMGSAAAAAALWRAAALRA